MPSDKSLQATRDGALRSASRFTLGSRVPELWSLGRWTMRVRCIIAFAWLAILVGCGPSPKTASRPDWLSPSAEIVFTSQWEDGFLPDATFKLKARASRADFDLAVKQLRLTPYRDVPRSTYSKEPPQWLGDANKAWDVSPFLDDTFIRKEGRWWQLARYTNGFLYYQSVSY